jgi:hypothetical protein
VCFDDCFALAGCAGGQDVCEVVSELLDVLWAGWGWWAAGELVAFVAAVAELVEFGGEVADAVAAGAFVEGAVFECGEVAVDGCFGDGDLAGDGVKFGLVAVGVVGAVGLFCGDGGVDEVGAAVEVDQRLTKPRWRTSWAGTRTGSTSRAPSAAPPIDAWKSDREPGGLAPPGSRSTGWFPPVGFRRLGFAGSILPCRPTGAVSTLR